MSDEEREKLKGKWTPILDSLELSSDKKSWLEEYAELHHLNEEHAFSHLGVPQQYFGTSGIQSGHTITGGKDLLPIAKQIAAKTIGFDLVGVQPDTKPGKSDKQKLREARANKIMQLEGKKPNIVLPDDIEVPVGPIAQIMYMDFVYSSGNTQNNI